MFTPSFDLSDHLRFVLRAIDEALALGASAGRKYGFGREQCGNTDAPGWSRYALPYCLHAPDRGDDRLIVLNRDYKPVGLGIPYNIHVDYLDFPQWLVAGSVATAPGVAPWWDRAEGGGYWLFGDGAPPWTGRAPLRAYFGRLMRLVRALDAAPRPMPRPDPYLVPGVIH